MTHIKTPEEIEKETAITIAVLSAKINNHIASLNVRFDHALIALLTLVLARLKEEGKETGKFSYSDITDLSVIELLSALMSDSILITYKKQIRETN